MTGAIVTSSVLRYTSYNVYTHVHIHVQYTMYPFVQTIDS